jgi:hypothetical protein
MKMHAKRNHLWLLASGALLLSSSAFALQINNNTGSMLTVEVHCGDKKDTFKVSPNQVGDCPSNVCRLNTNCKYKIKAKGAGSCSGQINGGSGLQVGVSNDKLNCQGYGG